MLDQSHCPNAGEHSGDDAEPALLPLTGRRLYLPPAPVPPPVLPAPPPPSRSSTTTRAGRSILGTGGDGGGVQPRAYLSRIKSLSPRSSSRSSSTARRARTSTYPARCAPGHAPGRYTPNARTLSAFGKKWFWFWLLAFGFGFRVLSNGEAPGARGGDEGVQRVIVTFIRPDVAVLAVHEVVVVVHEVEVRQLRLNTSRRRRIRRVSDTGCESTSLAPRRAPLSSSVAVSSRWRASSTRDLRRTSDASTRSNGAGKDSG